MTSPIKMPSNKLGYSMATIGNEAFITEVASPESLAPSTYESSKVLANSILQSVFFGNPKIFCGFNAYIKDGKWVKLPVSALGDLGVKCSAPDVVKHLGQLSVISSLRESLKLRTKKTRIKYVGMVLTANFPTTKEGNEFVVLDLDFKNAKQASTQAQAIHDWALVNGFLMEKSHSGKGFHIFIAVKDASGLPKSFKLEIEGAEVEIFSRHMPKSLMFTGDEVSGAFIDVPINLVQEMARLGININAPQKNTSTNQSIKEGGIVGLEKNKSSLFNQTALAQRDKWVLKVFPGAEKNGDTWRISSEFLGRDLEEDISIHSTGIMDFGVADLGQDQRQGRRTPIELVAEHVFRDINKWREAKDWLRQWIEVDVSPCTEVANEPLYRGNTSTSSSILFGKKFNPKDFPHTKTVKGITRIFDHIENFKFLLSKQKLSVQYCQIRKKIIFRLDGGILESSDNFDESMLTHLESLVRLNGMSSTNVANYIKAIADTNQINEVVDYLKALEWDGVDWIGKLASTLGVKKTGEAAILLAIWLKQCCAAADASHESLLIRNGLVELTVPKYESVLTVVGEQGTGKTKGLRHLLPKPLHKYFKDGLILDLSNKDSLIAAFSYWVVELGELDATFNKAQIAGLKAFLSNDRDLIRVPYARTASNYARRTSFCASANEVEILRDKTGNRRFLVIEAHGLMHSLTPIELDQVWAQAWYCYAKGDPWWPNESEKELIKELGDASTESDPFEDALVHMFNWGFDKAPGDTVFVYESRFTIIEIATYIELYGKNDERLNSPASSNGMLSIENAKLKGLLKGDPGSQATLKQRNYGQALRKLWGRCGAKGYGAEQAIFTQGSGLNAGVESLRKVKVNSSSGSHRGWKLPA